MERRHLRPPAETAGPTNPTPAGAATEHSIQTCLFFKQRKNSAFKSTT